MLLSQFSEYGAAWDLFVCYFCIIFARQDMPKIITISQVYFFNEEIVRRLFICQKSVEAKEFTISRKGLVEISKWKKCYESI